jgi:hypothetical protein
MASIRAKSCFPQGQLHYRCESCYASEMAALFGIDLTFLPNKAAARPGMAGRLN